MKTCVIALMVSAVNKFVPCPFFWSTYLVQSNSKLPTHHSKSLFLAAVDILTHCTVLYIDRLLSSCYHDNNCFSRFHFIACTGRYKLCVEGQPSQRGNKQQSPCHRIRVSNQTWTRTQFSLALFMKPYAANALFTNEPKESMRTEVGESVL